MDHSSPLKIGCRLATRADAPRLARMSRDYVELGHGWSWRPDRIRRFITASDSVVLCAEGSGHPPCGFAIMEFHLERAHLNLLAVEPAVRRQGVAASLLGWLEKTALIAGIARITLEVRARNVGARQFYARQGYEEFQQIPRYYSGRETAYRLRKTLRTPFVASA